MLKHLYLSQFSVSPSVQVVISPSKIRETSDFPATESEMVNLLCNLVTGNPSHLTNVTWFKDNEPLDYPPFVACEMEDYEVSDEMELFGELNTVNEIENNTCFGEQVVKLSLIDRWDSGEYSCQGSNEAGIGEISSTVYLDVLCKYDTMQKTY